MTDNIIKRKKSESTDPLGFMRRGMDDLFDDFFKEFDITPYQWQMGRTSQFVPRIDISETEKEYKISAELPGLEKKDVEIDLTDDMLTIKGEKKSEHKEQSKGRCHIERSYGSFSRSVSLPGNVKTEDITANFKNGLLNVVLPKTEPTKPLSKKIEIKS